MKKTLFAFIFIFLGFFSIYKVAYGATVAIEPSHFEIQGTAGNVIDGKFSFESDKGSVYQFSIREFEADGTKGQIKILPEDPKFPINKWVQFFPQQTTSVSSDPKIINFRINVPDSIEERDYYFVILAQPLAPSADTKSSSASILPGIATNVILSLFDKTKAQGDMKITLTGNKIQQLGNAVLELSVQNNLNKFQTVSGSIELKSKISGQVQTFPVIAQNVLSGAVRVMTTSLEPNIEPAIYLKTDKPGIFSAQATVSGDNGIKYTSSELTLIVLPSLNYLIYPLIVIILLAIAIFLSIKVFIQDKKDKIQNYKS